ncbi:MAG: hypothetical protein JWM00_87 [Candidatus Saccharibacteria bacterium]|nr:hypothetical protein [Candidatus Saccharibacteria bacterium]
MYMYKDFPVKVPATADMPRRYRPDGQFAHLVQKALDQTPKWSEGDDPIETVVIGRPKVYKTVVPTEGGDRIWAIHCGHAAKRAQVSPFVQISDQLFTDRLTVELTGTPKSPILVRAYPGEYMPPLPWMKTASWADGGREACINFWRQHAFVFAEQLIRKGSQTKRSPEWFTAR